VINRIRILLVDDHLIVRVGLRSLIETQSDMVVIAEASGGEAAPRQFEQCQPDVVLMDLRMPDLSGVQATAIIRQKNPGARVIVLTTFDHDEDIYRALQVGAAGYLLKNIDSDRLVETIRAVYARRYTLPPDVAARLAQRMAGPELSPREHEVLELIVRGRSNKEIGSDLGVAENTVKNHVKVVLEKLGVQDRVQATTRAIQRGIVRI
jgi:two-component system NarL family response regulator